MLQTASPPFDDEQTLQVFRWDEGADLWVAQGGQVDTAANRISVFVAETGVYGAFTTGQTAGVSNDPHDAITPETYELAQNHPNPFNPRTTVAYYLPQPGHVTLRIHNILGQTVRTLVDEVRPAGSHEVIWDGKTTAGDEAGSGVYFYQLRVEGHVLTRRMVLVK